MSDFIVISYYTLDTRYQEIAHTFLMSSLHKRGMHADVCPVLDHGSQEANSHHKPTLIKLMLKKHSDKDILFLDADAEVLSSLTLFTEIPEEYMIAAPQINGEFTTKTFFVKNCERARAIMDIWSIECSSSKECSAKIFNGIIHKHNVKVFPLPMQYCSKDDTIPDAHIRYNDISAFLESEECQP